MANRGAGSVGRSGRHGDHLAVQFEDTEEARTDKGTKMGRNRLFVVQNARNCLGPG